MKSKNLLLALALPVALTACTADDFMTDQSENPTVAGRKVVGNVTFVAPEGIDTRLVWDGGLKWSETDKLGAALMDELKADLDGKEGAAKYDIVNKLYSNYRYDYENGAFTNKNATFVEGNYFVYAQFNAKQGREGLAYSIPAVQNTGEDGRASWYENQMFLDHIFVTEGNSEVAVNPLPVFPLVTLKATYDGTDKDVVVKKIVISDATGKFGNVGTVQPAKKSTAEYNALEDMNATVATGGNLEDYKVAASGTLNALFNAYKKAQEDFGTKYTVTEGTKDNIVNPNLAEYFVAGNDKSESLALNYTKEGKSVAGIMVVPQQAADAHAAGDLKIEIYTNKGLVTIAGTEGTMSKAFTFNTAKDYTSTTGDELLVKAMNDIAFDSKKSDQDESTYAMPFLSKLTAGKISRFNIRFKDNAILVPSEVTVNTTAELEDYLANWYAGKKDKIVGGNNNTVTVKAVPQEGEKVEVNNTVLAFMANTAANPVLKFEGTITIPAGTNADALDKVTKGTGDLSVINEASLTWKDNSKSFTAITNKGTLTIGETTGTAKNFTATTGITNLGTLTVNGNVGTLVNGSNVAPVNATAEITLARGTVTSLTNYAVVAVNGESTITGLTNNKTLTVNANATLTTGASSVNNGNIEVAADATWNVNGNITNEKTVTNNGDITIVGGIFTNAAANTTATPAVAAGKVINNNMVTCSGSGTFKNEGDMEANANSITLISENANTGEVVVSDDFTAVNIPAEKNTGKVTYIIADNAKLANVPAAANSLRITATSVDFSKLKHTGIKFVEFRSTANVTVNNTAATGNENEFANVVFNTQGATSNVVFTMESKIKVTGALKITEKAVVFINKELEYSATVTTGFENAGSIMIVGTLNFSGMEKQADQTFIGKYRFTGGEKSNISWKASSNN